jgi:sugar lactone lactonase YvrE
MNKLVWLHLSMALGVSAFSIPATAAPPVGTISNFTANLANTVCSNPEGIAIDLLGNFYTASDRDGDTVGAVCVFRPNGTFKSSIAIPAGPGGVVALTGLLFEGPRTLFAADLADGEGTNGRLLAVDVISGAVSSLTTGFAFPNGIAEDSNENLFVSDSVAGTITRISQNGSNKITWSSDPLLLSGGFPPLGANGVAFDRIGRTLYVANTGDDRILRIPVQNNGTAGAVQIFADGATINQNQNTTGALNGADGIAFDIAGNLYVACNQENEIQVISPSGQLTARYTSAAVDFPASVIFRLNQLFFTNASLFDGGVNSRILVLQAARLGWPLE